jgi:hypothetical protein
MDSMQAISEIFQLPRVFELDNLLAYNSELLVYIKTPKGIHQVIRVDQHFTNKFNHDFANLDYHPFRLTKIVKVPDGSVKLFFAEKS